MTRLTRLSVRLLLVAGVVAASGCLPLEAGIPETMFQVSNESGQDIRLRPVGLNDPDDLSPPPPSDGEDDWLVEEGVVTGLGLQTDVDGGVVCRADGLQALDPDTGDVIDAWAQPICGGTQWRIVGGQ